MTRRLLRREKDLELAFWMRDWRGGDGCGWVGRRKGCAISARRRGGCAGNDPFL